MKSQKENDKDGASALSVRDAVKMADEASQVLQRAEQIKAQKAAEEEVITEGPKAADSDEKPAEDASLQLGEQQAPMPPASKK